MMNADHRKLTKKLQAIVADAPPSLKAAVAREALDYGTVAGFFSDLLQHGVKGA